MTNEELVLLYQQGDKQALDKLVEQNTGIVYKIANKFYVEKTNSVDKEDLEQEGFIGLITAAKKYKRDIENPAKFTTYAVHWVYSKISRYVNQKSTNEETSLNTPIGEDGDNELLDTIEGVDYGFENVEEKIFIDEINDSVNKAMREYLTLRQRQVLSFYFGIDGFKTMTYKELGELLGVAGSYIGDIKNQSLRKLRYSKWGVTEGIKLYEQL